MLLVISFSSTAYVLEANLEIAKYRDIQQPELSTFFSIQLPEIKAQAVQDSAKILAAVMLVGIAGKVIAPDLTESFGMSLAYGSQALIKSVAQVGKPLVKPVFSFALYATAMSLVAGVIWGKAVAWRCYDVFNAYKHSFFLITFRTVLTGFLLLVMKSLEKFSFADLHAIETTVDAVAFVNKYFAGNSIEAVKFLRRIDRRICRLEDMIKEYSVAIQKAQLVGDVKDEHELVVAGLQSEIYLLKPLNKEMSFSKIAELLTESNLYKADLEQESLGMKKPQA